MRVALRQRPRHYEIVRGRGSPGPVTDLLFVRRALRDALGRFATETAREVGR